MVVDLGTWQVKAGYAGDDTPKAVFPSVRARARRTAQCTQQCTQQERQQKQQQQLLQHRPTAACTAAAQQAHQRADACRVAFQLAGVVAASADANGMEVDGQPAPAAAAGSGRKLFMGSQELGYPRQHMEVRRGRLDAAGSGLSIASSSSNATAWPPRP